MELVESGDGAENPSGVHGIGEQGQFFRKRSIAQDWIFYFRREFKEIGEQAVEDAELIFERGFAVFGDGGGLCEKLGEALALGGAFEDLKSIAAGLGRNGDIHFEGEAGAAFGELRGEFDFGGLAIGFFFQDFFDSVLRKRREMELQAARDDCRKQCVW